MVMAKTRNLLWVLLMGSFFTGCNAHLTSPPSRLASTDGPTVLGDGETALSGQYANGGEVFGGQFHGAGVRGRHGLNKEVEISGSAQFLLMAGSRPTASGEPSPDATDFPESETWPLYMGRLGVTWSPEELGGHFALGSGIGGGYSDAGGFLSPDFGFSVGYQNPYLVPFAALSGFVSQPIGAIENDISDNGAPADWAKPELTYGFQATLGLRGEISLADQQALELMAGMSMTQLFDQSDEDRSVYSGAVVEAGYRF
jgi:hypothetical protein